VREREDLLADGDRDGQAGDPGRGGSTVPAVDRTEHTPARYREHEYARRPGRLIARGRSGPAQGVAQDQLFQGLAAGKPQRAWAQPADGARRQFKHGGSRQDAAAIDAQLGIDRAAGEAG